MRVVWLRHALQDRDAQLDYIAAENPEAALDQGDRLERQIDLLTDFPELGRVGRMRGTRELVVGQTSFIVVYRVRVRAHQIEILRVLHGAQQWPPASESTTRPDLV